LRSGNCEQYRLPLFTKPFLGGPDHAYATNLHGKRRRRFCPRFPGLQLRQLRQPQADQQLLDSLWRGGRPQRLPRQGRQPEGEAHAGNPARLCERLGQIRDDGAGHRAVRGMDSTNEVEHVAHGRRIGDEGAIDAATASGPGQAPGESGFAGPPGARVGRARQRGNWPGCLADRLWQEKHQIGDLGRQSCRCRAGRRRSQGRRMVALRRPDSRAGGHVQANQGGGEKKQIRNSRLRLSVRAAPCDR
jgi:hypothetical protein